MYTVFPHMLSFPQTPHKCLVPIKDPVNHSSYVDYCLSLTVLFHFLKDNAKPNLSEKFQSIILMAIF